MATYEEEKQRQKNKDYAYQFYLKRGYRPLEAAAIVGNLDIESGGLSNDVIVGKKTGDKGTAFGIAQWRGDRRKRLESKYKDFKNLDNQLDFVDWELKNTEKEAFSKLKSSNTVEEATHAFTFKYERPSADPKLNHFDKRLKSAAELAGVKLDPNFSYNTIPDVETTTGYAVDRSTYIAPTPKSLESSTQEYVEPVEDSKQVEEAKKAIAENSFKEDYKKILENQQNQISNLQDSLQQNQEVAQQQEFVPDDMQDPYNYITINPEYNFEEFQNGGTLVEDEKGVWNHPGQTVVVPTDGNITMKPNPSTGDPIEDILLGMSMDTGETKVMYPGEDYYFPNTTKVKEIPIKNNRFK